MALCPVLSFRQLYFHFPIYISLNEVCQISTGLSASNGPGISLRLLFSRLEPSATGEMEDECVDIYNPANDLFFLFIYFLFSFGNQKTPTNFPKQENKIQAILEVVN